MDDLSEIPPLSSLRTIVPVAPSSYSSIDFLSPLPPIPQVRTPTTLAHIYKDTAKLISFLSSDEEDVIEQISFTPVVEYNDEQRNRIEPPPFFMPNIAGTAQINNNDDDEADDDCTSNDGDEEDSEKENQINEEANSRVNGQSGPWRGTFPSREALMAHVKQEANKQMFGICITKSTKDKNVYISCERNGEEIKENVMKGPRERHSTSKVAKRKENIQNGTHRPKVRASRKTNCTFALYGAKTSAGWVLTPKNLVHAGHQVSQKMAKVSHQLREPDKDERAWILRQLDLNQAGSVTDMLSNFNNTFRQPIETEDGKKIQQRPKCIKKDIQNIMQLHTHERRNGQSPLNYFFTLLQEKNYKFAYYTNSKGELTRVFFMHPHMITMIERHPSILLLDCTYKLNKWRMPLLDIVGIDAMGKTFFAGWALLIKEEIADYNWALNAFKNMIGQHTASKIKTLFTDKESALANACANVLPNAARLLCLWHIKMNIKHRLVLESFFITF